METNSESKVRSNAAAGSVSSDGVSFPIRPSSAFLESVRSHGVQFLMPCAKVDVIDCYYWTWCLASGFNELGIPVYATSPAILECKGIQVRAAPLRVSDEMTFIADISPYLNCKKESDALTQLVVRRPRRKAFLCMSDGISFINFPTSLPTFVAHAVSKIRVGGRRIPWAFGLSREIVVKVSAARQQGSRDPVFLRNFRPTANQFVRNALDLSFVRRLAKRVAIDRSFDAGARWNPDYFARLAKSFGCLAYGGYFIDDLSWNEVPQAGRPQTRHILDDEPVIDRWDSWRLWESLASGCVTVALDFDEYGFLLPVKPTNGVHYVGLRFDDMEKTIDLLAGPRDRLAQIAEDGRQWAMTHYTPVPTTLRFLAIMEQQDSGT